MAVPLQSWRIRRSDDIFYLRGIIVSGHKKLCSGTDVISSPIEKLYLALELLNLKRNPNEVYESLENQSGEIDLYIKTFIDDTYRLVLEESERIKKVKNELVKELGIGEILIAISGSKRYFFDFCIARLEDGTIEEGVGHAHVSFSQDSFIITNPFRLESQLSYDFRYFPYQGNAISFYQTIYDLFAGEETMPFQLINTGQITMFYEFNGRSFELKPNEKHCVGNSNYKYEEIKSSAIDEAVDLYKMERMS